MLKSESRVIDGLEFTLQQLPARRAERLFLRLVAICGAPMLKSLAGVDVGAAKASLKGDLSNLDVGAMAPGLEALMARLTPEAYDALRDELLETATVKKEGNTLPLLGVYDDVMTGRILTAGKLLKFALEVNFKLF